MSKLKISKRQKRIIDVQDVEIDDEKRTLSFSFSSEKPVERGYGYEVLSHQPDGPDLSLLNNSAPGLFNHKFDLHLGVVELAWLAQEKRCWCTVRFGRSKFAEEKYVDVKDKILVNVSVAYDILDMGLMSRGENGDADTYVVRKWRPYEVSFVTVPADDSVGVGRSAGDGDDEVIEVDGPDAVASAAVEATPAASEIVEQENQINNAVETATERSVQVNTNNNDQAAQERARIKGINALGEKFGMADVARQMIDGEKSIEDMRGAVLEKLGARQVPINENPADIDLTEKEKRDYSLVRAIRSTVDKNWADAGFEKEVSDTIAKRSGKTTQGFFMPMNVTLDAKRAAYNTGTPNQGGNLVQTNLQPGSFIEMLRNRIKVVQLGATMLTGLVGNVAIPRRSGATVAYWILEGAAPNESEGTFDLVTLSPKTIAARSQITRQMLQQSTPDIELLVRSDLALSLALGIDKAAIMGTGAAGEPTGILNMAGIGSVAHGANGGAVVMNDVIDLETKVADANADVGSLAYLANAKTVGALKKLKSTTGESLWTGFSGAREGTPGEINGYPVGRSNQVPKNLTKGTGTNLSALLFGNWADLLIGEWGVLEILPNPYGAGFNSGSVDIRAMQTVDVNARHAESFSASTDLITD